MAPIRERRSSAKQTSEFGQRRRAWRRLQSRELPSLSWFGCRSSPQAPPHDATPSVRHATPPRRKAWLADRSHRPSLQLPPFGGMHADVERGAPRAVVFLDRDVDRHAVRQPQRPKAATARRRRNPRRHLPQDRPGASATLRLGIRRQAKRQGLGNPRPDARCRRPARRSQPSLPRPDRRQRSVERGPGAEAPRGGIGRAPASAESHPQDPPSDRASRGNSQPAEPNPYRRYRQHPSDAESERPDKVRSSGFLWYPQGAHRPQARLVEVSPPHRDSLPATPGRRRIERSKKSRATGPRALVGRPSRDSKPTTTKRPSSTKSNSRASTSRSVSSLKLTGIGHGFLPMAMCLLPSSSRTAACGRSGGVDGLPVVPARRLRRRRRRG